MNFSIDPSGTFTIKEIKQLFKSGAKLQLSPLAKKNIEDCRAYLDKKIRTIPSLFMGSTQVSDRSAMYKSLTPTLKSYRRTW
jgi:hypothetical protein